MGFLRDFATPLSLLAALNDVAFAQNTATAPGQPRQTGAIGQFEIIGDSGVSAQQVCVLTRLLLFSDQLFSCSWVPKIRSTSSTK